MELDDLKLAWLEQRKRLDATLRLNHELLRASNTGAVRETVQRFSRGVALEAIVNAIALLWLGSFAAGHRAQPGYLIPAVLLGIYVIVMIADAIGQIAAARSLDYDEPVVSIQKRLAALRVRHVRTVRWILLTSPLAWGALFIVALRAVGVDVYSAFGVAYVAANFAFGIAVLVAAYLMARIWGQQFARSRFAASLFDALAGRELTSALESLEHVIRFEYEPFTA